MSQFSKANILHIGSAVLFYFNFTKIDQATGKIVPQDLTGNVSVKAVFTSPGLVRTEVTLAVNDLTGGLAQYQGPDTQLSEAGIWKVQGVANFGPGQDRKTDIQTFSVQYSL